MTFNEAIDADAEASAARRRMFEAAAEFADHVERVVAAHGLGRFNVRRFAEGFARNVLDCIEARRRRRSPLRVVDP